ncbi:MAG: RluA family pseudouridine synthase [Clostridia bacterium]|nr:RluA family pseudouridine synthase [Clostridia bacterium]
MVEFKVEKSTKLSRAVLENVKEISYSVIMKLLRKKDIKVNDKRVTEDIILLANDKVQVYYVAEKISHFTTIYQDQNVVVIDKKSGYTSEEIFNEIKGVFSTAFFIHRLDRNTSGLMVFALNEQAEKELLLAFKKHSLEKIYLAEVKGKMLKKQAVLQAYLLKHSQDSRVEIFNNKVNNSVKIITEYSVIEEKENTSVLQVKLHTGKTHQIRAHLAHIGNPIVGDGKYGDSTFNKLRKEKYQKLKAVKLTLKFSEESLLNYLNNKVFESKGF